MSKQTLVTLVALVFLTASCDSTTEATETSPSSEDLTVSRHADVRCWTVDGALTNIESLADVLPNTLFTSGGPPSAPQPLTPLVVVGQVTDVVAGRAWAMEGDGEDGPEDGVVVPFDDPGAMWKHVHSTVAVDEVLASVDDQSPTTIQVSFTVNGDVSLEDARTQLLSEQELMLPLLQWAGTDYNADLWAVGPSNSALLAEIDAEGRLSLPCVGERTADTLLRNVPTLDALREAAARPIRVRHVEPVYLM